MGPVMGIGRPIRNFSLAAAPAGFTNLGRVTVAPATAAAAQVFFRKSRRVIPLVFSMVCFSFLLRPVILSEMPSLFFKGLQPEPASWPVRIHRRPA
jgi:hypothetical protein